MIFENCFGKPCPITEITPAPPAKTKGNANLSSQDIIIKSFVYSLTIPASVKN